MALMVTDRLQHGPEEICMLFQPRGQSCAGALAERSTGISVLHLQILKEKYMKTFEEEAQSNSRMNVFVVMTCNVIVS